MESSNNMTELEQMRQQMSAFKQKLDKQQIINEQLVRNSMGSKLSWLNWFVWGEVIMVPILLIFFAFIHASEGLSWWLFAFLAIGLIADVVGDYVINRIPKGLLLSGDLVETSKRLVKMKRQRTWWFIAGAIFCTIWLVWFVIEVVKGLNIGCTEPHHDTVVAIIAGGLCVGGLIGFLIAWLIFRKMQRTNSQLIEQINQIVGEG